MVGGLTHAWSLGGRTRWNAFCGACTWIFPNAVPGATLCRLAQSTKAWAASAMYLWPSETSSRTSLTATRNSPTCSLLALEGMERPWCSSTWHQKRALLRRLCAVFALPVRWTHVSLVAVPEVAPNATCRCCLQRHRLQVLQQVWTPCKEVVPRVGKFWNL